MPLVPEKAPAKLDDLQSYLDRNNQDITGRVNKKVDAGYGGLKSASIVVNAVTTTFADWTGYSASMPAVSDGVIASVAAGSLQVASSGVYEVTCHAIGEGNVSAIDWQLALNGAAQEQIPTENMAVSPSPKFVAAGSYLIQLEKGDTLTMQVKSAVIGTIDCEATFVVKRVSEAFD